MSAAVLLVVVWISIGAILCFVGLYGSILLQRRVPWIARINPKTPAVWPRLSIVVPACNEVATLRAGMTSLLAQDYPNFEIVLVEDRSTDGTRELADEIGASDPRVKVVHVETLPEGWLGKVHALQKGLEKSDGAWILFTDADIHFAPGALKKTIAWSEEQNLGHLCCIPEFRTNNFLVGLAVASTLRAISTFARPWAALNPRSKRAIGSGAYNLVRRDALEKTPGLEWLRMEVADDIALGYLLKNYGAKPGVLRARGAIVVNWYPSFAQLTRGLEKNAFAQLARFTLWRGLFVPAVAIIAALGPFAAFLPVAPEGAWLSGVAALSAHAIASLALAKTAALPFARCFFSMPFGDLLMAVIVARATIVGWRRGGLIWRGTVYPSRLLIEGRRVDF